MALSLLDTLQQNQNPGMQLPIGNAQPYLNNVGNMASQPNDILSALNGQGMQQYQPPLQMAQAQPQQQMQDIPLTGSPSTYSNQIQQALGAKPADIGGQIQNILAGRFQQPPLSLNDVGIAAQQTAATGQYVPAQQIANSRIATSMDQLSKVADLQKSLGEANYYNAIALNGGGRGEALALLNKLDNDPSTANLDLATKLTMVKSGLGVGNTMIGGQVQPIAGNLQTVQNTAQSKSTGEEIPKLQYAAPIAQAGEVGKAQGEAQVNLAALQANLPQVTQTIDKLINLSNTATYTAAGKLTNAAIRQSGLPVPQGAIDSADYESTVKNSLLPSLKAAFGARITNADLQYASDTLGDQHLSPAEKKAQLNSYLSQKLMTANTIQRQVTNLGVQPIAPADSGAQIPAQTEANISSGAPTQADIEHTAQKYGITTDEVKRRLGLAP